MEKAQVAYSAVNNASPEDVRNSNDSSLIGFQKIKCHIIFYVKINFTCKAYFVAGVHMTQKHQILSPIQVWWLKTALKFLFLTAAPNDLDLSAFDIGNYCLNAPCREKIWFEAGIKYGEDSGKPCKLVCAFHRLKPSGMARRAMFSTFIQNE